MPVFGLKAINVDSYFEVQRIICRVKQDASSQEEEYQKHMRLQERGEAIEESLSKNKDDWNY